MGIHGRWAKAPIAREQRTLLAPTLDDVVAHNDEVRVLDEILRSLDWSKWEQHYSATRGRPPIHPRVMAGIVLYGLMRRVRSSRVLEYMCLRNIDFLWLAEGHQPDHSTLCHFRNAHEVELRGLFRKVCTIAMTLGLIRLGEVGFDGTRVKASNSRYGTRGREWIEKKLAELDGLYTELLAEARAADQQDLFEPSTGGLVSGPLADAQHRRDKLQAALGELELIEASRAANGLDPKTAQLPMTDTDSRVMPNKEGGFAPNFTPTCVTDESGFVIDADVCNTVNESSETLPSIDRVIDTFGEAPDSLAVDGGMSGGAVLAGIEDRGIAAHAPVVSNKPGADHPANRDDMRTAVSEEMWAELPLAPNQKLDRTCFQYDAEADQYFCPMGQTLHRTGTETRGGTKWTRYRSDSCAGCPLASKCLTVKVKDGVSEASALAAHRGRTLRRSEHEAVHERVAARVATAESQPHRGERF